MWRHPLSTRSAVDTRKMLKAQIDPLKRARVSAPFIKSRYVFCGIVRPGAMSQLGANSMSEMVAVTFPSCHSDGTLFAV